MGGGGVTPICFLIFLLGGLKEACMPNFSFLGSFLQLFHYYSGRAARQLEELKIRRTQPILAGTGAELGNICHYVLVHGFHLYCWSPEHRMRSNCSELTIGVVYWVTTSNLFCRIHLQYPVWWIYIFSRCVFSSLFTPSNLPYMNR